MEGRADRTLDKVIPQIVFGFGKIGEAVMKYLLLILPIAACTPHVETCLTFPLPYDCESGGGGGLPDLAGGITPPKPDPGPAPAPEPPKPDPKPEPPAPDPKPPKPDHDDEHGHDDDDDDDDDRKRDKKRDKKERGHDDD
jgi:hypothetical protein